MRINYLLVSLFAITLAACSSEKETPNGFKFNLIKEGAGDSLAKPGQLLLVDFVLKDSKDSVWNDSFKNGQPAPVMIQDSTMMANEKGLMQMFRMLKPGDSVTTTLTIKEFFDQMTGGPVPPNFDSTLTLTYSFKIREISTVQKYQEEQQKIAEAKSAEQLTKDIAAIDKFLAEKGIEAVKTASGLRYVITKPGKGENGKSGQTATVEYVGYTLDGVYFDTSVKKIAEEKGVYNAQREPYTAYPVTIDQSAVIQGWHEALKLMNKGAKATVYIPSGLAYGPRRRSPEIGENQILVFDLEVTDLK
jgi:FKBP-type peptidyl-prolyl cis-trans isomerase FkpA